MVTGWRKKIWANCKDLDGDNRIGENGQMGNVDC